jgi:hypothetical protein
MELVLGLLGALAAAVVVVLGIFLVACVLPTFPKLTRAGKASGRTLDDYVGRVDLGQPVLATAPRGRVDQLRPGTRASKSS